ncbi:MAG: GlsB/YeaQ/YmgE family stress response membrane protein [Prevotella sp.]|nr:GlsB/YeaQ/YmgE family stress response membrane protein [Prevotella sp.]
MSYLLYSIIVGVIAGYIASRLTSGHGKGCLVDLILGIVGGLVGGWLFHLLDISWGGTIGQIGTSAVGALVVLWLWNKFK